MPHADDERCPIHALCPACARIARDALMSHVGLEPLSAVNERAAVVAWLRRLSESSDESILVHVATYIEHGAHRDRREEKP